jgi:hypothetical protein
MGYSDVAASGRRNTGAFGVSAAWLVPAAVVVIAILWRLHSVENADVSWLLSAAEKLLDGRRDFIEFNPPGAVLTYVPAVWLARFLGVAPELTSDLLVIAVASLSLSLVSRLLGRGFAERHHVLLAATGAAAILVILPARTFGEREHLGVILLLPWVAATAARLEGAKPDLWLRISAGVAGGLCVVVKPHFILNVAVLLSASAWRTRSWRVLVAAENCAFALVLLIYAAVLWLEFPDYLVETAPMMAAVYVPDRLDLATLLFAPVSIVWACTALLVVATGGLRRGDTLPGLLLVLSGASYATFLLQGKGWAYQSYPAVAFALLALVVRLSSNEMAARAEHRRVSAFLAAVAAFGGVGAFFIGIVWFDGGVPRDTQAIARAIEDIAPRPAIAAIASDLSVGFPVTRLVQGSWAQRAPSLLIAAGVRRRKLQAPLDATAIAAIEPYEARDRAMLRDDIRANRPDILLVEVKAHEPFDWLGWARSDPQFAAVLDAYAFARQIDDVQIWRRR